jgi:hypothetical protein
LLKMALSTINQPNLLTQPRRQLLVSWSYCAMCHVFVNKSCSLPKLLEFKSNGSTFCFSTGVHGENHWLAASQWLTLSYNVVSCSPPHWTGFELTTLVVIGTDCTGSCNSNHHAITTTAAPVSTNVL